MCTLLYWRASWKMIILVIIVWVCIWMSSCEQHSCKTVTADTPECTRGHQRKVWEDVHRLHRVSMKALSTNRTHAVTLHSWSSLTLQLQADVRILSQGGRWRGPRASPLLSPPCPYHDHIHHMGGATPRSSTDFIQWYPSCQHGDRLPTDVLCVIPELYQSSFVTNQGREGSHCNYSQHCTLCFLLWWYFNVVQLLPWNCKLMLPKINLQPYCHYFSGCHSSICSLENM